MVQHIGLSGETEKIEVTLLVMRLFLFCQVNQEVVSGVCRQLPNLG
jgi:hypothetical protein